MSEIAPTMRDVEHALLPIPTPGSRWADICAYADGIDGYVFWRNQNRLAPMGRRLRKRWERGAPLATSLDDLRSALFFEYRSAHPSGDEPEGPDRAYIDAVLTAIAAAETPL